MGWERQCSNHCNVQAVRRYARMRRRVRVEARSAPLPVEPRRVSVKAKACKADLKNGGMPDLNARKIDAHPVKATL